MGFFDELLYPTRASDSAHQRPDAQTGHKAFIGPGVASLVARQGFTLDIYSLVANQSVSFPAFLESFTDGFTSNWSEEQVYGRMDPISTFQNTNRNISVSWTVPAYSLESAKQNLYDINKLISFLYPQYADRGDGQGACGASTINMGPLMRIKFSNLIQDARNKGGLLGYVQGINFEPTVDAGMFMMPAATANAKDSIAKYGGSLTAPEKAAIGGASSAPTTIQEIQANANSVTAAEYYPKAVTLQISFTVLHEHPLGFDQDNQPRSGAGPESYPYAVSFSPGNGPRKFANPPNSPPTRTPDQIQDAKTKRLLDNRFQQGYQAGDANARQQAARASANTIAAQRARKGQAGS
jgi:hypothetical protein